MDIIPQRPPFLWIDALVSCEGLVSETEFTVPSRGILCHDGFLTEAGLIEHAAQSCAARIGYLSADGPIRIGVLGTVQHFVVHRLPAAGQLLQTRVEVLEEVFDITLVNIFISCAGEIIAQGRMKIALTPQEAQMEAKNVQK